MDRPSSLPAVLRSIAWVTSVAAMVVCGYILHKWPQYGNAVATGVVGIAIAMLNDSWQMVASAERLADFPMLAPARLLLHDVFALVVTVGGILMLVFMGTDESDRSHLGDELKTTASETDDEFSKDVMIRKAIWFMVAVCIWRVGFMITETWRCLRIIQRRRYLLARRRALGLA